MVLRQWKRQSTIARRLIQLGMRPIGTSALQRQHQSSFMAYYPASSGVDSYVPLLNQEG
jgi:hypothetical protein